MSRLFSVAVKETLRQRAGERCSFGGCQKATLGPDPFNPSAAVRSGEAAHIAAVSPGGPRFDPAMSDDECSSVDNGIWLCETCHREFDRKTAGWPASAVREIKVEAERRAYNTRSIGPGHAIGVEYQTHEVAKSFIRQMRDILGSLKDPNHSAPDEYGFAGGAKAIEASWSSQRNLPYVRESAVARLIEAVCARLAAVGDELVAHWSVRESYGRKFYAFNPKAPLDRIQWKSALDHAERLVQAFHQALEDLEAYMSQA